MTLRNRLLAVFTPLLVVPILTLLVLQLILIRSYLLNGQQELIILEREIVEEEFTRRYQQIQQVQFDTVPFFRRQFVESLYQRYAGEDPRTNGIIIIDQSGMFVEPRSIGERTRFDAHEMPVINSLLDTREPIRSSGWFNGEPEISYSFAGFRHEPSQWNVLIYDSQQDILLPLGQSALISGLIALVAVGIASVIIVTASRRIAEPIVELTEVVIRFGQGNTHIRYEKQHDGEVGVLSGEFNRMAERLDSFTQLLESRIEERTRELHARIEELRLTQTQLVESEKMAALGGLVAGFAHEVNTPVGVSITAASFISEAARRARNMVESGDVSRSQLLHELTQVVNASELASINLGRASEMIIRFKQVAADQYFEETRELELGSFLEEIKDTLVTILKPARARLDISVDGEIHLVSYPGVLWQLLSNLTRNSLHHAFMEQPSGDPQNPHRVRIFCDTHERMIRIFFIDNGPGVPESHRGRLFDPFFTTRRGAGNTGLGLNIVYNLVSQKLSGRFSYLGPEDRNRPGFPDLPGKGACFLLLIPPGGTEAS